MTLPELAIRRHVTTLMLIVSLVVLGSVALTRIPLAFLPDMEEPELFVRLPYPNATPEQVQRMVVRPVEDVLGSVNGLRRMWSRCDENGGMVRLEFGWTTDMHVARVAVWEKIDRVRAELPDDVEDITVSTDWHSQEADDPVLEIRLSSPVDLSSSYDLLDRRVVKPLQRVPGVAQVRLDGVLPREVRINLRLGSLEKHRIDVREVTGILRASNFDQSLGEVVEGDSRYSLRTVGSFRSVDEIRDLPLRADGLRLGDVADVIYEEPTLEYGRHLDGHFAVGITVSAEAKANSVSVCEALQERIAAMDDDPELEAVTFLVQFSEGEEIRKTLRELVISGIVGACLASLVLFIFLRRTSTTVISVLCIPFSLIVTCGIIWARGSTLNTLTLLGLIVGIGMLVDNAVVVIENVFRHQERGESQQRAALLGSREVSTAVIAATLTSVIVFLPIVFDEPNRMNIQFREIGITVCLTLLASLFISQTLIPLATSWFIRSKPRPRSRWMLWLEHRYVGLLGYNLRHRWLTPLVGLAVTASAIWPYRHVDIDFDSERRDLYATVRYHFSEERSLERAEQIVSRVEAAIDPHRQELMARSVYSYWRDHFAMTRIYLEEGHVSEENLARVRERLREILPKIAGVRLQVEENRRSWRWDRGKRVAFQLLGEDSAELIEVGGLLRARLKEIEGLEETFVSNDDGREEIHVAPERTRMARLGISPPQVAETVGLTFRGRRLSRYRTADGEREMRLTLDERETESLGQLHNLPLWASGGDKVPLAAVAGVGESRGPQRIERDERRAVVWVGAHYEKGTREDYLPAVRAILESTRFPRGVSWSFGDWQERRRRKSREFLVDLSLALLLVFAVMAGLFESVQRALALMIALPFALSGAIWTLYLAGADFDPSAAVGLLLLIGIVVNNGIVMIEHIGTYQRAGLSRTRAMLRGGRERLRPILMTALTTLLGLVPILVQRPSLGGMSYHAMALVIAGGLGLSTVLTTILLPTAATLVEDGVSRLGRLGRRRTPATEPAPTLAARAGD